MFPKDFLFGAATASYQIEGAWNEDGKGPSIWDEFSHTPEKIKNNDNGDIACDHYHRFREDVKLMKEIGLKAYRFSVSWPRILPNGTGEVNQKGIKFYRELLTELKAADIVPMMTIYHWDLPLVLQEKGGWCNREIKDWFAQYVRVIAENLGDLCDYYITFNEPSVFVKGYINGTHAPGLKYTPNYYVKAFHNILCAHGAAVKVLREVLPNAKIGCAPASIPFVPKNKSDEDECYNQYFAVDKKIVNYSYSPIDNFINVPSMFLDPIVFGEYPKDSLQFIEKYLPKEWKEDLKEISLPIDFIAENVYQGRLCEVKDGVLNRIDFKTGYDRTAIDWHIQYDALYYMLKFIYRRYKLPIMVSENGTSCADRISLDGKVYDYDRIDYTNRHLLAAEKAIDEGVPFFAYTHWSLMDNFEWARGYFDRFGLIYVDFETGERRLKESAYWYKKVIETNGEYLHRHEGK